MEHVRSDLADVAIWLGLLLPLIFLGQYTYLIRWYRSAGGRLLGTFTGCLALVFLFGVIDLLWPGAIPVSDVQWINVGIIYVICAAVAACIISLERRRRQRKLSQSFRSVRRQGIDDHGPALSLVDGTT